MDDWDDPDPDLTWPTPRPLRFNPTVLGPIFGAYHAGRHRLESAANEHGLDATEAMVLATLRAEPLCAPWGLRRRLGFPRSTMTSILDRLDRDGHIVRRASEFSNQRYELLLTTSGEIAADVAEYAIAGLEEEIRGYTSPQERQGAVAVFEACIALDRPGRPHR